MNHASVLRVLAATGLAFGGIHLLPLVVALFIGEITEAGALLIPLVSLSLLSSLILVGINKPSRKSQPHDGLAVVVLSWILIPLIAGIPFAFATSHENYVEAIHEAVSCLTTTGHSVLTLDKPWPVSLVIYRGVLHFFGGVLSLVTVVSVFAAINIGGSGIHRTELFTIPEGSFFDTFPHIVKTVLTIVATVILMMFLIIWLTTGQVILAFSDAISVATTGWVDPERLSPQNLIHQIALLSGLILSTVGLVVLLHSHERNIGSIFRDPEVLTFTFLLIVFGFFGVLAGSSVWSAICWVTSSLSTSGIEITDSPLFNWNYIALWIIPALIGGSGLSTAGGIKLGRAYLLARRTLLEFQRGAYPHSKLNLSFRGHRQSDNVIIGIGVYLIAYIAVTTAITTGLTFLGQDYPSALTSAVGSVSNAGFLVSASNSVEYSTANHIILIIGQILGRLEVLALVPVLNLEFWRR